VAINRGWGLHGMSGRRLPALSAPAPGGGFHGV